MRHSERILATGLALIFSALATDWIGSTYQLLTVLVLSFILAVAGAVISVRGLVEFLGDRL